MDRRPCAIVAIVSLTVLGLAACERTDQAPESEPEAMEDPAGTADPTPGLVEVTAVDYAFDAPSEIPSGWTTFRMRNEGREEHFLVLWRLPEGKTLEDYRTEVVQPFEIAYDSLEAGTLPAADVGAFLGNVLPEWFASVRPSGGPGLTAPGEVASTTVHLEPGTYVMECYVKNAEGEFHTSLGMLAPLVVTADSTGMPPPEADVEMTVTNADIAVGSPMGAGEHRIAVRFQEQPDAGLGNDVHLVRLEEHTDLDRLVEWMDWVNPDGLRAPAPARFLGGAQEMPVGTTAYFTVELKPGRHAWISEATTAERVVREFTVE